MISGNWLMIKAVLREKLIVNHSPLTTKNQLTILLDEDGFQLEVFGVDFSLIPLALKNGGGFHLIPIGMGRDSLARLRVPRWPFLSADMESAYFLPPRWLP